jgi:hypothetical protein
VGGFCIWSQSADAELMLDFLLGMDGLMHIILIGFSIDWDHSSENACSSMFRACGGGRFLIDMFRRTEASTKVCRLII